MISFQKIILSKYGSEIFLLFIIYIAFCFAGCKTSMKKGSMPPLISQATCEKYFEYVDKIVKKEQLTRVGNDSVFLNNFSEHRKCYEGLFKEDFIDLFGKPDAPSMQYEVSDVWEYYITEGCFEKAYPFKNCTALLLQFNQNYSLMYLPSMTLE